MSKKNQCCAVPECTQCFDVKKRHFFRFPKEYDRWLQWVRACGRPDLEAKGPKYAYDNCRICHLHFEEKWYNINKVRAYLHPDAIPTRFFGAAFDKNNAAASTMAILEENNTSTTAAVEHKKEEHNIEAMEVDIKETDGNIHVEATQSTQGDDINKDKRRTHPVQAGNDNRDTSNKISTTISDNNSQERRLRIKIMKLKAQNKTLRETVRRLRKNRQKNG